MGGTLKTAAMAAGLVMLATTASAHTVTFSPQNPDNIFDGTARAGVDMTLDGEFVGARAGAFRVTDGDHDYLAWCVDLATTLDLPAVYTKDSNPFSTFGPEISGTALHRLQTLFDRSYTSLNVDSAVQSAGFQVAIWEIIYDADTGFDLDADRLVLTNASAAVRSAAEGFLSQAAMDDPVPQEWILTFWESQEDSKGERSQNLLTVAPIPLPAGAWMLLGALAAAAGARHLRRRAT